MPTIIALCSITTMPMIPTRCKMDEPSTPVVFRTARRRTALNMTSSRGAAASPTCTSIVLLLLASNGANAFSTGPSFGLTMRSTPHSQHASSTSPTRLYSDNSNKDDSASYREGDDKDANVWIGSDDATMDSTAWEASLDAKKDGTFWSEFETTSLSEEAAAAAELELAEEVDDDAWLQTLAQLSSEEVEFNMKEADRADKARQMEEWGFDSLAITNTLDVATDTSLEDAEQVEGMQMYRDEVYEADLLEDESKIESHTKVDVDEETGEPVRAQMVYVDEHSCIGCTNCAMIAGNTFFMEDDHGRARVFSQWGDDDETIQIAIETCPVDCIHYIPYDELKRLEVDRRGQNINFKARLVGSEQSHMVGGAVKFSKAQQISGNMGSRCNNCPSRGCKNCPMFGVGKNPEFERREEQRKERITKKRLQKEREQQNKSADL
jgi:ferredoxin